MGFKWTQGSPNEWKLKLDRLGPAIEAHGERIMKEVVEGILLPAAVKNVPVDTGDLEKSFSTKIYRAGLLDNLIVGVLYIASNAPAAEYAMFMHEFDYKLGPRSKAKQEADPSVTVGRKYLERALTENEREVGLYIHDRLHEACRKFGFTGE